MQKNKKLLNMIYVLLALVVCATVFCFCMVFLGDGKTDESSMQGQEEIVTPRDEDIASDERVETTQDSADTEEGCAFDSLVRGSNMMKTETVEINGVKAILYFLDNYEKKPIVIVQHGLTSKKEDVKDLATTIADLGYVVVTPDAAGHGELKSNDRLSVMDMVEQTAGQFGQVLAYFQDSCYADVERTGLVGFSLGGLASFYYAGNGDRNPKVVVSLCSTPDFKDLTESQVAYQFYKNGKLVGAKNQEERKSIEEQLRSKSPYEKLLLDTDTYFFMVCGDADDVVPHEGNIRFYEEMKDRSKDIKLTVKEKQKHEITEEDLMLVLDYLKGHL